MISDRCHWHPTQNKFLDKLLVDLGASPRTTVRFAQLLRAYAWLQGRNYATPDDIKYLAPHVLAHRLKPSSAATVSRVTGKELVQQILTDLAVPVEDIPSTTPP